MSNQKGFTAIHVVLLLILGGFLFLGYTLYERSAVKKANEESYKVLTNLKTKLDSKVKIAESTPRIALAPLLSDLNNFKSEIDQAVVSECMTPAKKDLNDTADATIDAMVDFISDKADPEDPVYQQKVLKIKTTELKFKEDIEKCKSK